MSRRIDKLPEHAYMVVDESYNYPSYHGPYSTLSAAKGKRTTLINVGSYYSSKDPSKISILKSPAGEWEKVEL